MSGNCDNMAKSAQIVNSSGCDDLCVENTNSESLLSKLSVVDSGYRVDPFLKLFRTQENGIKKQLFIRSAAINRGYLSRLIAIECTVEKYLLVYSAVGIKHQVLSLGAGYDTLYFRLRNQGVIKPEYCSYYEVDYPIVPYTKCRYIIKQPLLKSFFKTLNGWNKDECVSFDNWAFNMVGCNMTDTKALEKKLNASKFNWNLPTIVFCECSLTYVEAGLSIGLTSWLTRRIPNMIFVDYEQIIPFDSFGRIMFKHFQKRNSPLKCVEYYPTMLDHQRRFMSLGWSRCHIFTIDVIFNENVGLRDRIRWKKTVGEQFDETEEFKLKCTHYIVLVGSNANLLSSTFISLDTKVLNEVPEIVYTDSINFENDNLLHVNELNIHHLDSNICARYGHCIWTAENSRMVIFGGYSLTTFRDNSINVLTVEDHSISLEGHHSVSVSKETIFSAAAQQSNGNVFIFGGRASPRCASNQLYVINANGQNIEDIVSRSENKPEGRWKHTLSATSDNKLVLIGGKNQHKVFADLHVFELTRKKWTLRMKLPTGIYSHSACVWRNEGKCHRIVVTGGLNEDDIVLGKVYIIDINERRKVIKYRYLGRCT